MSVVRHTSRSEWLADAQVGRHMALSSVYRAMMGALGVVGAVSITFSPLAAQRPDGSSRRAPAAVEAPDTTPVGEADSGEGRPFRGRRGGQGIQGGPARQQLEGRVRQVFEQVVRRRLGLTDVQVQQLRQSNQRFAPERRALAAHEREIRQTMRAELRPGSTPNEARLSVLIDSLFVLQRARLDMLQSEQRQLATFLTPSQRVRYYALQEQLRRRIEAMRQRRQGAQGVGPAE